MVDLQKLILEMIARGEVLAATAERLCREMERLAPGVVCSIVGGEPDATMRLIAAPSLPEDYQAVFDSLGIRPSEAPGGGEPGDGSKAIGDPAADFLSAVALPPGVGARWSAPIRSAGKLVGALTFFFPEQRVATDLEREIAAVGIELCRIAFERDFALRANQRLLYTDSLTGLHNRACFEEALMEPPSTGGSALLLVDIDGLKTVNDTFGHNTGDSLIRTIAQRLAEAAAPYRAFRIGGDELAVLAAAEDVVPLAHRILDRLGQAADCAGHMLVPSMTIGAAIRAIDDKSGMIMRQNADLALYHGKDDGGRGSLVLYAPELRTRMNRRLRAIDQLRRALAEGRIEARYQPIVRLDSGAVTGFEALARIRERDGRIVAAADFQDAFADARNASDATRAMLRAVSADLRSWLDAGIAVGRVAVNLAPADFAHGHLVEEVQEIFVAAGVPLDRLALEITESVYLGRRELLVQRQMEALRSLGIKLALDDFGTGYASLTHLLFTPVDTLKVDKSFVDHLNNDEQTGGAVINGLMRIAEKLGVEVVAEGVETVEQRERLVGLGCRLGQGHLYSGALDSAAVGTLMRTMPARLPSTPLPTSIRSRGIRRRVQTRAA
ncbi:putative bifunctional diguanylate cyclase/phosphodiesterase [Sphingomonas crusticola]|uniref:putative bifunctional diguanylate cyclase/phosphodiesterase n=1 Tax=Sphingomonas crusticola TaxID=1697973 RepID=UPI000E22BD28|nr:GGDEF domain-containing protein [Sphingomonas crusticola]